MPKRRALKRADVVEVYGGFKSLFQGDHLGVEFALESHTSVLRKKGLLVESEDRIAAQTLPSRSLLAVSGRGSKKNRDQRKNKD